MFAFTLTTDQAEMFFELCQELNAVTEQERYEVLQAMAQCGQVTTVVQTPKTKEDYIKHLAKNFKVLQIKEKENDSDTPS